MIGTGWKSISLVDVYGSVTFTLWLCGCNLKCPFCHNWRLATNDKSMCKPLNIELLIDELFSSISFIDYLHITGGEPLVQYRALEEFLQYIKNGVDVKISLNTNLTLFKPFKRLLEKELLDHVATDLKIPFKELIGYNTDIANTLWRQYLKSLRLIVDYNIPLELRIPVSYLLIKMLDHLVELREVLNILNHYSKYYVIIEPLLGEPITTPRSNDWCKKYCNPSQNELIRIKNRLIELGFRRVYTKNPLGDLRVGPE